jgi:pyridoxine kinase
MRTKLQNSLHNPMPRVLAIHDLSGHSHTSLMAVIPVMSHQGISVTALPTAILSSNTEYSGFELADMTPHLDGFLNHWKRLKLSFTAIYSGFLCNELQVETVIKAIELFRKKQTLVVVDPVMGDNGSLYPCFGKSIIKSMQRLVSHADIITPNLTEAAFLLNEPYRKTISVQESRQWCRRLSELGPGQVLITNLQMASSKSRTSVVAFDRKDNRFHQSSCRYLPVNYPGTGDVFTSVLTSLLLNGTNLFPAVSKTVRFTCRAIKLTLESGTPPNDGICLEKALKFLPGI